MQKNKQSFPQFNNNSLKSIKTLFVLLAAMISLSVFSQKVEAEVLFEGYYKVTLSGVHAGYIVQRYELDAAKKTFTGMSYAYIRLNEDGKQFLTESLVAKSDDTFHPLSYQFSGLMTEKDPNTEKIKNKITSIDATFKKVGNKTRGTLKGLKDGKNFTNTVSFDRGVFLSNFLLYLWLQKGFKVGFGTGFNAFAEESGEVAQGKYKIEKEAKVNGVDAFKINWSFKGMDSVSFISVTGQALSTESPAQGVIQELVSSKDAAVGSLPFADKSVKALFGGIPEGKKNTLADNASKPAPKVAPHMQPSTDEANPGVKVKPPTTPPPSESSETNQ